MHRWKPNVTVAIVIERINSNNNAEYLLVYENRNGALVYNQPAGHLDEGEGIITAAVRETLEETAWHVTIDDLISIYRFVATDGTTYMRHAFSATPIRHESERELDTGIIEAVWMTYEDIIAKEDEMYSPMVRKTIDDYKSGKRYPLSIFLEPDDIS